MVKSSQEPVTINEVIIYTEGQKEPEHIYRLDGGDRSIDAFSYENLLAVRDLINVIVERRTKEVKS